MVRAYSTCIINVRAHLEHEGERRRQRRLAHLGAVGELGVVDVAIDVHEGREVGAHLLQVPVHELSDHLHRTVQVQRSVL